MLTARNALQRTTSAALAKIVSRRCQSTSTMGAIAGQHAHPVQAYAEKKDFSTVMTQADQSQEEAIRERIHLTSLVAAIQQRTALNQQQQANTNSNSDATRKVAKAQHMSLVEAADAVRDGEAYDKILILMHHGEAEHQVFERRWVEAGNGTIDDAQNDEDYPADPMLTGKGVGQALNLGRRTATFCNDSTGLVPDLFVTSPLRRATQTMLLAFPYYAPNSVVSRPWVCHGGLLEQSPNKSERITNIDLLKQQWPGVDYSAELGPSLRNYAANVATTLEDNKIDLLGRTDDFLAWIKARDERVIAISSHSTWLQSFCGHTLQSKSVEESFEAGDMQVVAIKF